MSSNTVLSTFRSPELTATHALEEKEREKVLYKKLFFTFIVVTVVLLLTQFAAADYTITNNRAIEPVWVIYSTWKPADGGWRAGFRTQGWYRIEPGGTIQLPIPAENTWVYLRIERPNGKEIKPPDYTTRNWSRFWKHPSQVFTIVETSTGDILQSDVDIPDLEQAKLYAYRNGGTYTIPEPLQGTVRIFHFLPNDLSPLEGIESELRRRIKDTQQFFAAEMERQGFGRKTFTFETDQNGEPLIHWINGRFADNYYQAYTFEKILAETLTAFDISQNIHLIFMNTSNEGMENGEACGVGWNSIFEESWDTSQGDSGFVIVPVSGGCVEDGRVIPLIAHELGHAFGLEHDFRSEDYVMSFGEAPNQLSQCSAEWLDASKFFNPRSLSPKHPTTFAEPILFESPPDTVNVSFEVKDLDGLHQVQLIVPTTDTDPSKGIKLHSCQSLKGTVSTSVKFSIKEAIPFLGEPVTFSVIDIFGNIKRLVYTFVPEDIQQTSPNPTAAAPMLLSTTPTETAVFPNYPNPFNPETWIPYQLAAPTDVKVSIYTAGGRLVRTLELGQQPIGVYDTKSQAAYWDGRNQLGEPVASGVYIYMFTAGEFSTTGKMLIQK